MPLQLDNAIILNTEQFITVVKIVTLAHAIINAIIVAIILMPIVILIMFDCEYIH